MKKARFPQKWQKEAGRVSTKTVQYWRNGAMLTAQMSLESARLAVVEGRAFVISSQAIGALDANGEMNS